MKKTDEFDKRGRYSMNKKIEKLEKQLNKISEELESLKKEEQEWPQFGDDCFYCNSSYLPSIN